MTKFRIQKMRLAKQFHSNNLLVFATAIIFIIYTNKYNSIMWKITLEDAKYKR